MSACLILQTPQTIFIGSDSAISTTIENQIYRLTDDGVKLWDIDDKAIFCSGDMDLAYKIIKAYTQLPTRKIENLKLIIDHLLSLHPDRNVCVIVCHVDKTGSSVVYDISPETDYQIIERRMDSRCEGIALWSAGIKTKETAEAAEGFLYGGYDVLNTYRQVYNRISYEGVGGCLTLKQVTPTGVKDLLFEPITEKPDMKILTEELFNSLIQPHLIVGERVMGKLLAGQNLIIDASDSQGNKTFTVDANGVTIAGTKLTITGGLSANQLDPAFKDGLVSLSQAYNGVVIDSDNGLVITKSDGSLRTVLNATDGFRFQKKISGAWSDKFYYDADSGNLVMDGTINARELKINGTNVLVNNGSLISGTAIDKIKVEQLDATTAKIGSAMIGSIYANQITVGGGTIADNLLSGGSRWNGRTTLINDSGIYTGTLTASQINAVQGISLGANATINWNYVSAPSYSQINGAKPPTNADSTIASLPNALGSNYTQIGATFVYTGTINANQIIAGKISAQFIDTTNLSAQRIYQKDYSANYAKVGGQFGDLELYYNDSKYFSIYNGIDHVSLLPYGNECLSYSNATRVTYARGSWDFSGASVSGLTAKFA